ncbi:class I adenylate-forming enzyme family protein [Rhodococcus sp. IEGM 1366]|uniref:class I adenylate-forming enzyme family protein n=1 Tax=Rhodococcus sp. IEGM 1366 TaxID=3082223 RepID=UPI002954CACE|nr:class I adenylate-forming enzyme family protein [Rhodococcus sp. IEGM 1366]MDV8071035.1 class I adenylate-forming enzyme family protein [Rhodococcus sp. IEGM 1366]
MNYPLSACGAVTVDAALRSAAEQFGDRVAFIDGIHRITYGEWARAAAGVATILAEAGARPGQVVCLALPTSIEFAVSYIAALWTGATVTGVDTRLGPTELTGILGTVQPVVTVGAEDTRGCAVAAELGGTAISRADVVGAMSGPEAAYATGTDPNSPAAIAWTSGTTGAPKGAWYSHRVLEFAASQSGPLSAPYDRRLFATPFAHVGFLGRVWEQLAWAITTVLTPRPWSASAMLETIERERITVAQGVPLQWQKVLEHPDLETTDLSSLRIIATGATRVPPELVRSLRARLLCPVVVRYASSEVPLATGTSPEDPPDITAETVGRPLPGVEAKIVDEDGIPVGRNTTGRLLLRSPGAMSGYWNDPVSTREAIDHNGWIDVGDQARQTDRGDIVMLGRRSDMYVRAGYNVHPLEVERILSAHPEVLEAAVLGVPAAVVGEIGVAFIVPEASAGPGVVEKVRAWCNEYLADYKAPDRVEIVDELPRNAMGKIDKRVLRSGLAELTKKTRLRSSQV